MVIAGPILFGTLLVTMWLPAAIGILISEAFAIRSWIFHALNGAASAWLGWQMFGAFDQIELPLNEPRYVIAAGLAGGFAYWAVAGRTPASGSRSIRRPCRRCRRPLVDRLTRLFVQRDLAENRFPSRDRFFRDHACQSARANKSLTANAPIRPANR